MKEKDEDSAVYYTQVSYVESREIKYIHGIARSFEQKAYMSMTFSYDFSQTEQMAREALRWFDLTANKKNFGFA